MIMMMMVLKNSHVKQPICSCVNKDFKIEELNPKQLLVSSALLSKSKEWYMTKPKTSSKRYKKQLS